MKIRVEEALRAFSTNFSWGVWERIDPQTLISLYVLWLVQPYSFKVVAVNLELEWFEGEGKDSKGNEQKWEIKVVAGNPEVERMGQIKDGIERVKVRFKDYGDTVYLRFKGWGYKWVDGDLKPERMLDVREVMVAALPPAPPSEAVLAGRMF